MLGTASALHLHEHRHTDRTFDARLRTTASKQMTKTNLARREAIVARMRDRNPVWDPATLEKIRAAEVLRPRSWYRFLDGGNGRPATAAERALFERLASGWVWQHCVPTKVPRGCGYPTNYKIDLANPELRLAVEVDGESHRSLRVRAADERKEARLRELGWRVLRFANREVLEELERVVASIKEASQ